MNNDTLLETINSPADLKRLDIPQLTELAEQIRRLITHSVSRTGGHLASNLGVIETTIALHYVFDFAADRLLWDVGHQCYAHKILTGRRTQFDKLRQEGGLSGFPCREENAYDTFTVGHAGTSIATAIGMAIGAAHNRTNEKIVAIVGDASIVNGLSFEALNNMGLVKRQLLVVLNDNSMAIDVTPGAVAGFLSKVRLSHTYEDIRRTTNRILDHLPVFGRKMEEALEGFKKSLRMAISPSRLFESLNIPYFGPVDGHDIRALVRLFDAIRELDRPVILHLYTKKGRGFAPADQDPRKFHSTGPFELNGEAVENDSTGRSFTQVFGDSIAEMGRKNPKILAITAAMPDGTGLDKFRKLCPQQYIDVGIAESAAVDIAAGLARQGLRPFVCIYSTFLQRCFDQIFQEVSLQNLPVVFCIDRAGAVGGDGPTHHGMMDIGCLRMMPNLEILCPADEPEIVSAIEYAAAADGPVAIRYPRGNVPENLVPDEAFVPFEKGKSIVLRPGRGKIVIVAAGTAARYAVQAAEILSKEGIDPGVVNARCAKPVDRAIVELFAQGKTVILAEDHGISCGFGSAVLESATAEAHRLKDRTMQKAIGRTILLGGPDAFLPAAERARQLEWMKIDADGIAAAARKIKN